MSKSFKNLQKKMSKKQKQMSKELFDRLIESTNQAVRYAEERNRGDHPQPLSKEDEEALTRAWKAVAEEESLIPDMIGDRDIHTEQKVDVIVEQIIENLKEKESE